MTASVCMGIYNGAEYLEAQLESIRNQTKAPDEVILCEDGSLDRSGEIAEAFIKRHGLSGRWKLCRNRERKGYPGNFYHAMSLCTMDVVFLADQDDIWAASKMDEMCKTLETYPEAKCVCCKFGLIDGEGKDIHSLMQPAVSHGTGNAREVSIGDVFYKCEWPGMVMAYRRAWFEEKVRERRPGQDSRLPHDFLVSALAAEDEGFLQIDSELAYHRRHEHNTGREEHRLGRLLNRRRKLQEIEKYNSLLDIFREEGVLSSEEALRTLEEKRKVMGERYEALLSRRMTRVAANAWRNRRMVRPATVLCDLVLCLGKDSKI
ncbi:MAG: glycosyltransferase [Lachnospiraceae bacterium]|nr:glycosyltransferase [Lachnospiraceae bacterium]